jgi:hypothetical protein
MKQLLGKRAIISSIAIMLLVFTLLFVNKWKHANTLTNDMWWQSKPLVYSYLIVFFISLLIALSSAIVLAIRKYRKLP